MKQGIINFIILLLTILTFVISGCTKPGWVVQESGTMNYLRAVWFTDANTGTIVGGGGIIMHTINGVATWTIQRHDTTLLGLTGVYFTDANTGTTVGYNGTILHTITGVDPLRGHFPLKISDHTSGNYKTIIYGERSKHLF